MHGMGDYFESQVKALFRQVNQAYEQGNYEEGIGLGEQLCQLIKSYSGTNHPAYPATLSKLAGLYSSKGRWVEAEKLYLQAKEILAKRLGIDHPDYAANLSNLAGLYKSMGTWTEAEKLYLQVKEIQAEKLGIDHPSYATTLNGLAGVKAALNHPHEALSLMQEAETIETKVLGQVFSISSDSQRLNYLQQNRYKLDLFLSLISQHLPQNAQAIQAALDAVLRRKALGLEAALVQRSAILSGRYPHLKPQLEKLRQLAHQINTLAFQVPPPEAAEAYKTNLASLYTQQEELDRQISRQIPEMNLQSNLENADRNAIAAALPANAKLVEFVRYDVYNFHAVRENGDSQWLPARYLAFILPANAPDAVQMIDLGEAEPIDGLIRQFRQSINAEQEGKRDFDDDEEESPLTAEQAKLQQLLIQLHQTVIDPILTAIEDTESHTLPTLFIAPDGELSALPFGILPTASGHCLMEAYNLRYLGVGRDILRFQAEIPTSLSQALVIANPEYNLVAPELPKPEPKPEPLHPGKPPKFIDTETLMFGLLLLSMACGLLLLLALINLWLMVGILVIGGGGFAWFVQQELRKYYQRVRRFEKRMQASEMTVNLPNSPEKAETLPSLPSQSLPAAIVRNFYREGFAPIPGTALEGEKVASFLGVNPYTDIAAVKSVISRCQSPAIVHIATHGYFLETLPQTPPDNILGFSDMKQRLDTIGQENPLMRSGLAFAGANSILQNRPLPEEAEDAFLTTQNTVGVDLTGTRLVVASACQTALGDVMVGEGVLGLRRAFILAGAQTLVMSLWKVPDIATAILMERFYTHLLQDKLGRTEALEKAQYEVRDLTIGQIRSEWLTPEAIDWVESRSRRKYRVRVTRCSHQL